MSKDLNNPNVDTNVNPAFNQGKDKDAASNYAPTLTAFNVTSTNDKTVTIEVVGKPNITLINARSTNLMESYTLAELYACVSLQSALKSGDLSAVDQNGNVIKTNIK